MTPDGSLTFHIDARAASEVPAGRGRVVRELLSAIARDPGPHRYVLHARRPWAELPPGPFDWRLRELRDGPWHLWSAATSRREAADAYLATNSYLSALLNRTPTVVVIYDLVAFADGLGVTWKSRLTERLAVGFAVRRAAHLLCISEATREGLISHQVTAEPISSVAWLGASLRDVPPGAAEMGELPDPGFVLAVGTLEPRKNLPRLVAAYAKLPEEVRTAHPLVVVGAVGWRSGPTLTALQSLGSSCRQLGQVSDGVLAELYRRCAVFCYPSLNEGFGLPVLEAMAAGAPVLTSDVSSLPEVGADAVAYADPTSTEAIAAALMRLLNDPDLRAELRRRGPLRARDFSWDHFRTATVTALERAAG